MDTIEVGGTAYPIAFGVAAMRVLEREWGRQTGDQTNALEHVIRATLSAACPVGMSTLLIHAGIEGGRRKYHTRLVPFSTDEIDQLIDDHGGVFAFLQAHFATVAEAFKRDNAIRVFVDQNRPPGPVGRPPTAGVLPTGRPSPRRRRRSA